MALANIAGLDYESTVIDFNVRPTPGTVPDQVVFKAQKGTKGLEILDVQPDNQGATRPDGQVYQWFKLRFTSGQEGWLRSHVLTIEGDLTRFGYGMVSPAVYAYKLMRVVVVIAPVPEQPPSSPPSPPSPTTETEVTVTIPAPAPPTPAPTPETPAPPPVVTEDDLCAGMVNVGPGARLRQEPLLGAPIMVVPHESLVKVLEALTIPGQVHRWLKVDFDGIVGWTREDLLTYSGDCGRFDLPVTSITALRPFTFEEYGGSALYPVPMKRSRFVRGFTGHQPNHPGVDFGGDVGEEMLTGPVGGLVVASVECTNCNDPQRPSTVSQGLGLANQSVFMDQSWNFGYGHYVIVRYLNCQIPVPTRERLRLLGMADWHIFALYAHLSRRDVEEGDILEPNQVFAACGNTGNSSGPHVHLELRASRSSNFSSWASLHDGLIDPMLMFEK